jgi:hypothetical protein
LFTKCVTPYKYVKIEVFVPAGSSAAYWCVLCMKVLCTIKCLYFLMTFCSLVAGKENFEATFCFYFHGKVEAVVFSEMSVTVHLQILVLYYSYVNTVYVFTRIGDLRHRVA